MPEAKPMSSNLHDDPCNTEREVLYALTDPRDNQPLWSLDDLSRELGDRIAVQDAIHQLQSAGLIHRTADGFIFASRAAVCLIHIVGRVQ